MITVVLVDDHPLVLAGLVDLTEAAGDMTVVGTARDGETAIRVVRESQPQLVVMDLSMPGIGGVAATQRILDENPDCQVLVLTSATDRDSVVNALQAGATGYWLKDREPEELVGAFRAAARGEVPLDPCIAGELVRRPSRQLPGAVVLTERERDVLGLLVQGLANKQIAHRLGIRESTVKSHLGSAFQRIGVSDRVAAAVWAANHLAGSAPGSVARPLDGPTTGPTTGRVMGRVARSITGS